MAVQSLMVPLGTAPPDFTLTSTDGQIVQRDDFADSPALLVMFLCNHCPYVRHVERKLGEVLADYPQLAVVGICSNDTDGYPEDGLDGMAAQQKRAGWRFPYLLDETQDVVRAYQGACTPDFFLYGADVAGQRHLAYRGAFDESSPSNGKPLTGELLREAIELVLAGKSVPEPHIPSMGCSIKYRS